VTAAEAQAACQHPGIATVANAAIFTASTITTSSTSNSGSGAAPAHLLIEKANVYNCATGAQNTDILIGFTGKPAGGGDFQGLVSEPD
jgi:hypothetical protein